MTSTTSGCALAVSHGAAAEPEPEAAGLDGHAASVRAFLARSALAVSTAEGRFWPPPALEDKAEVVGRATGAAPTATALISRAVLKEPNDNAK